VVKELYEQAVHLAGTSVVALLRFCD